MTMARHNQSKARAGFTLLEVMVSLTVGGIALGSIYAVGAASTRHFREQQRISAAQTSLRSAMATLKHDFQRAGFMSTPNSLAAAQACSMPTKLQNDWIGAVNGYKKNATKPSKLDLTGKNTVKDADGNDFYSVDSVWLTGNYATSGEYPNISVADGRMSINIPMGWQSFQRDFTEWSGDNTLACNQIVFSTAFPANRLVRLHAQNGTFSYAITTGARCDATTAIVDLSEPLPDNCNMEGGWIAPVNTMYYRVEDADADHEDDPLKNTTVLKRTEVMPEKRTDALESQIGGKTVVLEDRWLLDYVVRFKVDFLMLDPQRSNDRISYVPMTEAEVLEAPQRVRGAIIDIAVRTPKQESDFTQDVPTSAFKLFEGKGAARVRRMRAELLLPNIANRNLLPP
jgi:prepilin-type N-terminal cleavage/methylation domain-containing protein